MLNLRHFSLGAARKKDAFIPRRKRQLLLLFLVVCLQIGLLGIETRAEVECSVVSLNYPSEVVFGRPFTMLVTVNYSFAPPSIYSLKVQVLQGGYRSDFSSDDVIAGSEAITVMGVGSRKFSVQITAPLTLKEWSLTVLACFNRSSLGKWWFVSDDGGYKSFSVLVRDKCRVSLRVIPSEVVRYTRISGEGEYAPDSTVSLSADRVVSRSSGVRYLFVSWTVDGTRYDTEVVSVRITHGSVIAVAEFKVQYELKIESLFGNPQGSGWYDEGSVATFSVTSPANLGIHIFERWSGNSTSTLPKDTIVMSSPKTIATVWKTDNTALIVTVFGVSSALVAGTGFLIYSRKRKIAGQTVSAVPAGVLSPETPSAIPAKAVPETPTAVKEVKQVPEAAPTMKVTHVKEIPPPKMILRTEDTSLLDDRVYNCIAEHGGEVSLSQAAEELGITVHDLNAAIDRLKNQGRLA